MSDQTPPPPQSSNSKTLPGSSADEQPNPTLCNHCQLIFPNWPGEVVAQTEDKPSFAHYETIQEVYASAEAGCPLCSLFASVKGYNYAHRKVPFKDWLDQGVVTSRGHVTIEYAERDLLTLSLKFSVEPSYPSQISSNTESESSQSDSDWESDLGSNEDSDSGSSILGVPRGPYLEFEVDMVPSLGLRRSPCMN